MKVTVKTMDVGSREFELADEATVETLKKQIAEKMEIPLEKQRLIFHGKVLKDEKPLKEYGVDGMVVHLVKSAPPPPGPGEGGAPINQPRRRIVTSSVRQDDDHTITLEATQDMLFMSPEGLPSEGDIAQMTQNIVSQIVGALSSHGAHGTVSAEATATDTEGKTHVMSATASTKKPDEIQTKDSIEDGDPQEGAAKPAPPKSEEPAKTEASQPAATAPDTEKATPTAPPPSEPGPSGVAAASGQEEEVKSKPTETKTEEPQRRSLFEFDDDDDPEELDRLEQERIQRSMKNLYSQARTVRRCLHYATKVLDRYDKSQERVTKKKAEDEAKRAAGIPLDQEVMLDLREALIRDRRKAEEEKKKDEEKMEVNEDDPFAILQSGKLDFIPSQLYLKFKDELDQTEARAQPIISEFRRLVEENQNLNDDELVQAQRVAITVKDFNYYIGHAYVALGRLDVQLDRPAPRHLRLYAPRRTEMRRIFQQLRSMPPQPPSGYIIDIQREGEGGGAGDGTGSGGQGRNTRAMISRGPAGLFGSLAGLAGADRNQTLSEALGRRSRSGGLEELVNRTTGPEFKAKLDEVRKEQAERHQKEAEAAEKEAAAERSGEASSSSVPSDTSTSTSIHQASEKIKSQVPRLETKDEEAMDVGEQAGQDKAAEQGKAIEQEIPMEEDKPMEQEKPMEEDKPVEEDRPMEEIKPIEQDKPVQQDKSGTGGTSGDPEGGPSASGSGRGAAGGEGEKKESGEKKEGGEGEGEDDAETPQYLARLLSELITGMVAPGMEAAPNDAIHEVEKKGGGASAKPGGGASADTSGDSSAVVSEEPKPTKPSESEASGEGTSDNTTSEEPKKMSFAERYAGPEGTTVTIKAAPQMPSFPGLPPMDGPSVSIRNPGGGKPPEAVVNFPMPPAFQLLRMMLRQAQMREKREQEEAAKGGTGEKGAEGSTPDGEAAAKKPKKPRLVLPPKQKEKPFVEDDGDLSSVSDAGSIDSIDSDDEGPKDEDILFGDQSLKGIGEHRSMHDAMAELRDHFGDADDDDEEEMGMVEMLLKAISHQITVIEVMGVFRGNTDPLKKLQQPLLNFISDRTLYGAPPTAERKDVAVKNFLVNCQSSIKAVEHRIPLRDRGIDFPKTMYNCLFEIFQEGFETVISRYRNRTPTIFARSIKYWATRSSARFGAVVRHCLDGDGPEFEETVKVLMSTLFPPTTPPMILTMCSSSILKEIRRLKDNHRFTPPQMEKYLAWKEGATPTPNRSYMVTQYMQSYVMYHDNTPLPVVQKESLPTEEGGAKQEGVGVEGGAGPSHSAGPQQPFSDAYLMEMPAKKRKLDTSEIQTVESPELLGKLIDKAFDMTGAKPLKDEKTKEQHMDELKKDQTLISSLVEEFYYSIRERLEKDPDYDPEKYPNAHKFFNVRKWPGQKKEEDKKEGGEKTEAMKEDKTGQGAAGASSEAKAEPEGASASSTAAMGEDGN